MFPETPSPLPLGIKWPPWTQEAEALHRFPLTRGVTVWMASLTDTTVLGGKETFFPLSTYQFHLLESR